MEYLVNVGGEVSNIKSTVYSVKAKSEEEAKKIATERFKEEYDVINGHVYTDKPNEKVIKGIIACVFMLIAIVIAFHKFPKEISWIKQIFSKEKDEFISLKPSIKTAVLAIAVYTGWVVRFKGIINTVKSKLDVALCIFSILTLSTFFNLLLNSPTFFGIELPNGTIFTLLVLSAIFSWMKLKSATALCLGAVLLASVSNIFEYDAAMGVWGAVYVICVYLGILFSLSIEPQVLEALPYIKQSIFKGVGKIKKGFEEAGQEINQITGPDSKKETNNLTTNKSVTERK